MLVLLRSNPTVELTIEYLVPSKWADPVDLKNPDNTKFIDLECYCYFFIFFFCPAPSE